MIATAVGLAAAFGIGFQISTPADEAVKQLEVQMAQTWQQREQWQAQQMEYHRREKIEAIDFRMRYLSNEINRINAIPQYLNRPITPEEAWLVEQYKQEWAMLREERRRIGQ